MQRRTCRTAGDPDEQLVGVLGMDASSMAFAVGTILGDDFLWNYLELLRLPASAQQTWWSNHLIAGRQALTTCGYNTWDPRVIHLGMAPDSFPIPFPTVQTGPLSETDPLANDADLGGGVKGNYIEWLRQATIDDIRAENYPGPQPTSLLYKILRQSMLLDYVTLAQTSRSSVAACLRRSFAKPRSSVSRPRARAATTGQPMGDCWRAPLSRTRL